MNKYERIIYWSDDDNKYIVEVPELSGCMADGETIEEANANCDVVIAEWIETAKMLEERYQIIKGSWLLHNRYEILQNNNLIITLNEKFTSDFLPNSRESVSILLGNFNCCSFDTIELINVWANCVSPFYIEKNNESLYREV